MCDIKGGNSCRLGETTSSMTVVPKDGFLDFLMGIFSPKIVVDKFLFATFIENIHRFILYVYFY